jgi:hypothetical protein
MYNDVSALQANTSSTVVNNLQRFGAVCTYKTNEVYSSVIGNSPTVDITVELATGTDRLEIGAYPATNRHWNGHVSRLRYFPYRLPTSEIQSRGNI